MLLQRKVPREGLAPRQAGARENPTLSAILPSAATTDVEQASHKLAEALYKKAQREQGEAQGGPASDGGATDNGGGPTEGGRGDDNVVDADFEEVKPS